MIDFRYHLVSIISIFLALAVGIVLGAGPLQQNLGTQLGDQVSALRTEKQQLNDQLSKAEKQVAAGDDYATSVASRVVAGRLTGHRVAVIEMPSVESGLVDTVEAALRASGARVTTSVTLTDDWFDPAKAPERAAAAKEAAAALGLSSTATGDALLHEVLARALVTKAAGEAVQDPGSRKAALTVLTSAKLVTSPKTGPTPADVAVLASGEDFTGTRDAVDAESRSVRSLALALSQSSAATVVPGGDPVAATGKVVTSDAVAAIRQGSATSATISTVDHARQGRGPAVVVLAIEAALEGTIGQYGVAEGATAVMPEAAP
ncbi:MAG: copper transporter [Micrococcales bacterium]|nr:copper transporter [Micrococcales bacterium]